MKGVATVPAFALALAVSSTFDTGTAFRATPPAWVPPREFFPNDQITATAPGGLPPVAPEASAVVLLFALRWLIAMLPWVAAEKESPQATVDGKGVVSAETENSLATR